MEKSLIQVLLELGIHPDMLSHLLRLLSLPHGSQFNDVLVLPDEHIGINADDASDFFYCFLWLEVLWAENAVGGLIHDGDLLKHVESPESVELLIHLQENHEYLQGVLTALGMGDQKASHVAQSLHQHILQTSGFVEDG